MNVSFADAAARAKLAAAERLITYEPAVGSTIARRYPPRPKRVGYVSTASI